MPFRALLSCCRLCLIRLLYGRPNRKLVADICIYAFISEVRVGYLRNVITDPHRLTGWPRTRSAGGYLSSRCYSAAGHTPLRHGLFLRVALGSVSERNYCTPHCQLLARDSARGSAARPSTTVRVLALRKIKHVCYLMALLARSDCRNRPQESSVTPDQCHSAINAHVPHRNPLRTPQKLPAESIRRY